MGMAVNLTSVSRLGVGTASFGFDYGIANKTGKVPRDEIFKILAYCKKAGINLLDTAYAYGDSENTIGEWMQKEASVFRIVSKTPSPDKFDDNDIVAFFQQSLKRLQIKNIYGYLIHKFEDLLYHREIWNVLEVLKQKHFVQKIGCSLYKPQELQKLFDEKLAIDIVQIPYSVFDRRFESFLPILKEKKVEVHVRSVFLQGLVFLDPDKDLRGNLVKAKSHIEALQESAINTAVPIEALCLNFVLLNPYVDIAILGINNVGQLIRNISYLNMMEQVEHRYHQLDILSIDDEDVLLPYKWKD